MVQGLMPPRRLRSLTQQSSRSAVNFLQDINSRFAGLLLFGTAWVCLM